MLASGGYPVSYQKGFVIEGLDAFKDHQDLLVFHAGTAKNEKGQYITNGGRVLGVVALDTTLEKAIAKVYDHVDEITFDKVFYRHDIGRK